jgi:hypothetical protein
MNFDPQPFDVLMGLGNWGIILGVVLGLAVLIGLLVSLLLHRRRVFKAFGSQSGRLMREAIDVSPRRIWALTVLTFRESVRRKALMVGVVFALLFMFAGWFLANTNSRAEMQVKVHVSFVLTAISFLLLPMVLLLACWGLPEDIKARSLHTVVTKPARRHEVYLGRILGFSLIGTLLLAFMGLAGYIWIVRQVPPDAQNELVCRVPVYGELSFLDPTGAPRKRGINVGDVWEFRSFIAGGTKAAGVYTFENVTPERMGNRLHLESRFEVFRTYKGNQKQGVMCEYHFVNDLRTQTARDLASARKFETLDEKLRQGIFKTVKSGPNSRDRVEGADDAMRAIAGGIEGRQITFTSTNYRRIQEGYAAFADLLLPLKDKVSGDASWIDDMAAQARACSKAADAKKQDEIVQPLKKLADAFEEHAGQLQELLVDKVARLTPPFPVPEFRESYQKLIDAKQIDVLPYYVNGKKKVQHGNLFRELVHGGKLKVHLICLDPGQYVGMARPDLFIRLPDYQFWVGYTKALGGIWLLMVLVVTLGVTASTFLKGPVATLLTFVVIILGSSFHEFLEKLVTGKVDSAGTLESAYRLVNHQNPRTAIAPRGKEIMDVTDNVLKSGLWVVHKIVPNFDNYKVVPYVANGFDVPWNSALLPALLTTLGFLLPCLFIGYLSLALRELEEK